MSQHARPATDRPEPPSPSFAEQARTLVHLARLGTLATQLQRRPGFPFASLAPYGVDAAGRPSFLVSTMAVHTQNLAGDARASLLVAQPDWAEDPLAGARATLVGPVAPVPADEVGTVRESYLARHENARYWVDFEDFAFWRMAVEDVYFVAGFGAMGWVDGAAYAAAAPDPLAEAAHGILAHMNADHADALVLYCRAFAGLDAEHATMTGIDRLGFRVRAQVAGGLRGLRLGFPEEVRTTADARRVLVEMVRDARSRLAG
jgi:putative heme iron utilization protein